MTGQWTRSLVVALLVTVVLQATRPASASAARRPACHATIRDDSCCLGHRDRARPDCCKVKTLPPQPVVAVVPSSSAVTLVGRDTDFTALIPLARIVHEARPPLERAVWFPLKVPHDPTYLRISVLLI